MPDVWADGARYDRYIGRWSRLAADAFVAALEPEEGSSWLDAGCGTGALTAAILAAASPASVDAVDSSSAFLEYARAQVADERARFHVGDAQALELASGSFHAAVSGLVLNFLPHPERAVAEMARVTRPGGTVAAYVWDYAGEMQVIRRFWEAAVALDPAASDLDESRRFPLARPAALEQLFRGAELGEVAVWLIDVTAGFGDFDAYWTPFLGGQGPAGAYAAALDEGSRAALRDRLHAELPVEPDGSIRLLARAYAVRGLA